MSVGKGDGPKRLGCSARVGIAARRGDIIIGRLQAGSGDNQMEKGIEPMNCFAHSRELEAVLCFS
jgi:hypothetical protein